MDTSSLYQSLDRHDQHLQRLIHGQQAFSLEWVRANAGTHPQLAAWLAAHLKMSDVPALQEKVPEAQRLVWRGWIAYYRSNYLAAAALFSEAWGQVTPGSSVAADIALGFGKVYTRSGHWQEARNWLLQSLAFSRQGERLFGMVQGYGALGELMLRGNQPQAAHACMSTAYHMLPPGSGQQSRQLNYLASSLMRTKAFLRAESLLMSSLHMALDAGDDESVWHALARLQFLVLDRAPEGPLYDVALKMEPYLPANTSPVAASFLHAGRGIHYQRRGNLEEASACLQLALALVRGFTCEQQWIQSLIETVEGRETQRSPEVAGLLSLKPVQAAGQGGVVDRTWAEMPLSDENGFACLMTQTDAFEEVCAWRSRFFV